jgi:Holliday junction resolvase
MGRMQRNKGAAGERELAKRLCSVLGLPEGSIYRSRQFCGSGGDHGDVLGADGVLDSLHVECKRQESGTTTLYKWLEQAIADAGKGQIPVVMHRMNLRQWIIVLELDDLANLAYAIVRIVEQAESMSDE